MTSKDATLDAMFAVTYKELVAWRAAHPEASLDEIAAQVSPRLRRLMGMLQEELALQHGDDSDAGTVRGKRSCGSANSADIEVKSSGNRPK